MPVINHPALDKYKVYYTEKITGKDGVTRPITKVKYQKPCPQCHGPMEISKYRKGGTHKSPFIRWSCLDVKSCKHSEADGSYYEEKREEEELDDVL